MTISAEFLKILACPKCKGPLSHIEDKPSLECNNCLLSYPIRDEIPVLLVDEAESTKRG
jgi:uncharacterized protein YbaR (Trm112 family)